MISFKMNHANLWFEKVPDWTRRHRRWIWMLFIWMTVIVSAGIGSVKVDMTMDVFFQEDDPMKVDMDHFRAIFGSDDVAYIIYKTADGDVFSDTSLRLVGEIQEQLQNYRLHLPSDKPSPLDYITDVKTILNASYIEAGEDALIARNFIGNKLPGSDGEREQLRKAALDHKEYPLLYVSRNTEYGAILIRTDFGTVVKGDVENGKNGEDLDSGNYGFEELGSEDESFDVGNESVMVEKLDHFAGLPEFETTEMYEYAEFMAALNGILKQPEYTGHLEFHAVGIPELMSFMNDIIMVEMNIVTVVSLALILAALLLLFRSWSAVVWPILIVIVTLLWVIGLVGWSGVTMTIMITIIVFLVLAIGVADTVHILSGYLFFRERGESHEQALRSVFRKTALACMLTSITTMIGLFSLLFVPIAPIQNFGIFSGIGVLLAFVFTVFVLPVMLDLWQPYSGKRSKKLKQEGERHHFVQRTLLRLEPLSHRYPLLMTLVFSTLAVILAFGVTKVEIDTNMVNIIKEGRPLRVTYDLVDRFMGGTANAEILVNGGREDALKDPRVLRAMEDLQKYMETEFAHLVTKTSSLVDVTKDSYRALNEGRKEMYVLPEDTATMANTLFLFNNSNPKDRRRLVTDDYALGRITINLRNAGSREYTEMIELIHEYAERRFSGLKPDYPEISARLTGNMALLIRMTEYVSWSQIQSFTLALTVISLLLLVIFASLRAGMVAILPNVMPILTVFGVMGYLKIPLDTDTLLVAPITIGIAVDDTIHFLTHYRTEITRHGNIKEAIIKAFRETGQAITFTSIILSAGFLIFLASSHQGLSNFGVMSAVAFFTALLADLFLLPSMCVLFKVRFGVAPSDPEASVSAQTPVTA